jgi:hypothetical protein
MAGCSSELPCVLPDKESGLEQTVEIELLNGFLELKGFCE